MISFVNNNNNNNNNNNDSSNFNNESNSNDKKTDNNNNVNKPKDVIEEKKRKLTLPIVDLNAGTNGINSIDKLPINKRLKNLQQQDSVNGLLLSPNTINAITNASDLLTPLNKDFINQADFNMSTPQLDKLLAEYHFLKTPGSGIALLTPNALGSTQMFVLPTPTVIDQTSSSFPTFSSDNNNNNIDTKTTISISNNNNNNNNNNNQNNLYMSSNLMTSSSQLALTPTSNTLINPTSIFGNQINTQKVTNSDNNKMMMNEITAGSNNLFILQPANTNNLVNNNNNNNNNNLGNF
jgi:hypothetical protein